MRESFAAVRMTAGIAVAAGIAATIIACGGGTSSAPGAPSAVLAARTVTVNVVVKNTINNAVESDVTIRVTIGNRNSTFKGSATPWVNTAQDILTSTQYKVEAVTVPGDYVT